MIKTVTAWLLPTPAAAQIARDEFAVSMALSQIGRRWRWLRLDRIRWLALALALALVIGLRLYGASQGADPATEFAIEQIIGVVQFSLAMLVLFTHLWMIGLAVRSGGMALSRERDGRDWELLILTGVRARDLVIGKWVGLMLALWRQFRGVVLWRVAAALALGVVYLLNDYPLLWSASERPILNVLPLLVGMAVCLGVLGAINVPLALTIGMVGSALTRTILGGMRMALFLHLSAIFSMLILFFTFIGGAPGRGLVDEALVMLLGSLLEGGSLSLVSLLTQSEDISVAVVAIAIGIPLFGLIGAGLLLLSIRLTVVRGAST